MVGSNKWERRGNNVNLAGLGVGEGEGFCSTERKPRNVLRDVKEGLTRVSCGESIARLLSWSLVGSARALTGSSEQSSASLSLACPKRVWTLHRLPATAPQQQQHLTNEMTVATKPTETRLCLLGMIGLTCNR